MLCYLRELARLDQLGALVLPYCAFILAASGEVLGAGGNKKNGQALCACRFTIRAPAATAPLYG